MHTLTVYCVETQPHSSFAASAGIVRTLSGQNDGYARKEE